ncbi:hypothetical protein CspHIS471_0309490 [Cutaneotrichosporon sp. HIS471]|nr:hypothetical protein CspHIS471_0309490 [Cutaneotrichosporon sp. HIS471]
MSDLDVELELIAASLMPSEGLTADTGIPRIIIIANAASQRTLHIEAREHYPACDSVTIELKGNDIGRDAAVEQNADIAAIQAANWGEDDYPLYQLLTAHLLTLLSAPVREETVPAEENKLPIPSIPHHTLLTSHHLLSNTKRKNFLALASQLSLTGFSKVGHPGVYYAIGEREDLEEWTREVRSWNWLALRLTSAPLTFLEPLDLATYPTTFGPEDEDPFYVLRKEAKKVEPASFFRGITTTTETQAMLKAALAEMGRSETATILERIGKGVEPPFDFSKITLGPMTARGMRELQKLHERLTPPRSIKQLFLPSSRFFMCGYASVPRVTVPLVTPLDAIDAVLKLDDLGPAIKDLYKRVAEPAAPNGPDKIWARWGELDKDIIDWHALKVSPPIFPMRANEFPFVVTYEYTAQLVGRSTPLPDAARGERPAPSLFLDVFEETEDMDPYSSAALDEFDEIMFEELSATTRASSMPSRRSEPRRFTASRFISSRSREPLSAWKHMREDSYSPPGPYLESMSASTSQYYSSKPTFVNNHESYWHAKGDGVVPQHPTLNGSFQREQQEHRDNYNYEAGDESFDFEAFGYEPGSSDFSSAPQRIERAATQPAPPWNRTSGTESRSSTSLTSAVPLGADFARHDLDWTAMLQTSDGSHQSHQLASPIKMAEPPTPDSNGDRSDPEPPLPRSDWTGPSRQLTYGEPHVKPRLWQATYWKADHM